MTKLPPTPPVVLVWRFDCTPSPLLPPPPPCGHGVGSHCFHCVLGSSDPHLSNCAHRVSFVYNLFAGAWSRSTLQHILCGRKGSALSLTPLYFMSFEVVSGVNAESSSSVALCCPLLLWPEASEKGFPLKMMPQTLPGGSDSQGWQRQSCLSGHPPKQPEKKHSKKHHPKAL